MSRTRVALTDTFVLQLEQHLLAAGRSLDKPCDVSDAKLRGLIIRRERSGHRTWHFAYTCNGRRSRVSLGAFPAVSTSAARAAAALRAAEVAKGTDPIFYKRERAAKAAAERADAEREKAERLGVFVEGPYAARVRAKLHWPEETLAALKFNFGHLWDRRMSDISLLDIQRWQHKEKARGIKPATINRGWSRLQAVFKYARKLHALGGPPLPVEPFKVPDRRIRYLAPEERARLLKGLEVREIERRAKRERLREWQRARGKPEAPSYPPVGYTDHLPVAVILSLGTGLRRGELLQLLWSDIDWPRKQLNVRGETAKNKRQRYVPLPERALEALRVWHSQARSVGLDRLIFPGPRGTKIGRLDTAWRALLKAAKIKEFRWHDLRHTYASALVDKGVPLYTVSELLGHRSLEMTMRYSHLSPNHKAEAVAKLNELDAAPAPEPESDACDAQAAA